MKRVASNSDLRKIARRRVPKMFFDYVDGGAWTEATSRANADDLARIRLKQRVAVDVSRRSAKSTILAVTYGVVIFSIVIQGLTIERVVRSRVE